MSVLIKGIDKELYAKFKASAAMKGLRINDALCQAMKYWIEKETPKDETEDERMRNNATYRRLIPELIKENEGKWVVISNGQLIGIFPDKESAINSIKEKALYNHCNIVSPITKVKRKVTLGFGRRVS
ncbi:MAG: hypothetical protein ACTSW1_05750 [Candidatus Hodarchaeales archaeon]